MRPTVYTFLIVFALLSCMGCRGGSGTAKVVKPKYHHRWFDRKKDKRIKRTRVVKMRN